MKSKKSEVLMYIVSLTISLCVFIIFAIIAHNGIKIRKSEEESSVAVPETITCSFNEDIFFENIKKSSMNLPDDSFYYNLLSSAPEDRRTYIDLISGYPASYIGKNFSKDDYDVHGLFLRNEFDAASRINVISWLFFNDKYLKIINPSESLASYNLFYGEKTESYSDYNMEAIKKDVIPVFEDIAYEYISSLYFENQISYDLLTDEFTEIYVPQAYRQELLKNGIYPDKIYRTLNKFEEENFISSEKITVIPSFVCSSFFVPCNYTILINFENSEIPIDVWDVLVIKPVYNESSDTFSYKIDYSFSLSANSGENAADLTDLAS